MIIKRLNLTKNPLAFWRRLALLLLPLMLVFNAGCASLPAGHVADQRDPWERYNRAMFTFNHNLDQAVIKPVAEVYRDYVPELIQTVIRNFFGNLRDIATAVHQLLQGKPGEAGNAVSRVAINSTVGFLGLADPASDLGFQKSKEDFGQTFGRWGAGTGPYFVIPVLGPSSVRDTAGVVLDRGLSPNHLVISDTYPQVAATVVVGIDRRKELLSSEGTLEAISFDRYSSVRDAYFSMRENDVYDGDPPLRPMKDD